MSYWTSSDDDKGAIWEPRVPLSRRTAIELVALGVATGIGGSPSLGLGRGATGHAPSTPWLFSPEQLAAEQMIMQMERDPEVKAIQASLKAELATTARAKIPAAATTLDSAIAQWTRSLIMAEVVKRPWAPVILWATDDTPRSWLGHTLGGVGASGDNPDAIYRMGFLDTDGRYELLGRFHPESRPTQLLIEVSAADMSQSGKVLSSSGGSTLDVHPAAMISDRELVVAPNGTFRVTVGGNADGPNHLSLPASGTCSIGSRDMLADWKLRPCQMRLRRLDKVPEQSFGLLDLRRLVLRDLRNYLGFWSNFPNIWMGSLKPNTHSQPAARPGGWGFVAGLNFHLAPSEALLVTLSQGQAEYTGFQVIDPWMIAPDARTRQVCLNTSQSTPNADGTVTYVISKSDPGAANWLDTAGLDDGFGIMRWQQVPSTMTNEGLIRDFRVLPVSDLAAIKDLPRITPQQRLLALAARSGAYDTRVR